MDKNKRLPNTVNMESKFYLIFTLYKSDNGVTKANLASPFPMYEDEAKQALHKFANSEPGRHFYLAEVTSTMICLGLAQWQLK